MENKTRYPRDMSFIDKQGNVVHPSKEDYNTRKSAQVGKAYAFFDCKASKEGIEAILPDIRESVKIPRELELSLMEDFSQLKGDLEILDIARDAKEAGIRYAMQAKYPNATNKKTADELSAILNQAYQSPLYQENEQFRGWILYKDKGQYVERE